MGVYAFLVQYIAPFLVNIISASLGMVANFVMQWFWVFRASRSWYVSFALSISFSLLGIILGTILVYFLTTKTLLAEFPVVAKCIAVIVVFFYNFLTKKFSFGD